MESNTQHRPTVCDSQGKLWHATLDIVRLYVLPKGHIGITRPTWSDPVFCPKVILTCHTQHLLIVYAFQGRWWYATPDVVWPCMLPKDDDGMPRLKKSDLVFCTRVMRSCHAQCHLTMCFVQGKDGMQCPTLSYRVCFPLYVQSKGDDGMPHPTSSIVCVVRGRWWHATPNVVPMCVLPKGNDGM